MSYKLNRTDGSLLVELVDGQIDTTSSDITLIGRNYVGFGEVINENFIKLLENFSGTATPGTPITGQLWFDTSENRLKVYDGTTFKANGPIISASQPQMVAGDLWINNDDNQLYFFDGSDIVLVGPPYTSAQGKSGFETLRIVDTRSLGYTVIKWSVGNAVFAYISNDTFTPRADDVDLLPGLTGDVLKGINIVDKDNFRIYGVSDSATSLITSETDPNTGLLRRKTASQFLPSDAEGTTTGILNIQTKGGLTIGDTGQAGLAISGEFLNLSSNLVNQGFRLVASNISGQFDPIRVDAVNRYMGINVTVDEPTATLDVFGDMRVRGDITIEGSNTTLETATLTVDDYNIELGHADTIITLSGQIDSSFADTLAVGDQITQSHTGDTVLATGKFKEYQVDTVNNVYKLVIEPTNNSFLVSGDEITVVGKGDLQTSGNVNITATNIIQRSDATATGAGITIKGAPSSTNANDKTIKWTNDLTNGPYFELNDSVNIPTGETYKINGHDVISSAALAAEITTASGLANVGILDTVRVRQSSALPGPGLTITYDEGTNPATPTITTYNAGLKIVSQSSVDFNDTKIKNVTTPLSARHVVDNPSDTEDTDDHVVTKGYVDTEVAFSPVMLQIDVTGLPTTNYSSVDEEVQAMLTFYQDPTAKTLNAVANVITTQYGGAVTGIDVAGSATKETISVDFTGIGGADGGQNPQALLEDINFNSATGTVSLSVTRKQQVWKVTDPGSGKVWTKQSETNWT